MAQEERNRLVEWFSVLRKQIPVVRRYCLDWFEAVREEPRLIWETDPVRYAVYGLSGLLTVWIALGVLHSVTPPPPASARPEATSADYHVVCSNRSCSHHFVIHRSFGFRGFPVKCSGCAQETGSRALRCTSTSCKGRWVAPVQTERARKCPQCGMPLP